MNKFQKLGLAALLSTLLVACGPEAKKEEKAASADAKPAQAEQAPAPAAQPAQVVDAKAEFQQVLSLDSEFTPALNTVQQKMLEAQSKQDVAAIDSAVKEYNAVMDNAISKYNSLDVKNAEVKAFKDQVVKVLKETADFTKEASTVAGKPEVLTPELQQSIAQKQITMLKDASELQKLQTELTQKFGDAKK